MDVVGFEEASVAAATIHQRRRQLAAELRLGLGDEAREPLDAEDHVGLGREAVRIDGFACGQAVLGVEKIIATHQLDAEGDVVTFVASTGATFDPGGVFGDEVYFAGIVKDLSRRKEAESEALRLGRIIDQSPSEVYVFDPDTLKFLLASKGGRDNLGYTLEEMQGLTPVDLKPDHDAVVSILANKRFGGSGGGQCEKSQSATDRRSA